MSTFPGSRISEPSTRLLLLTLTVAATLCLSCRGADPEERLNDAAGSDLAPAAQAAPSVPPDVNWARFAGPNQDFKVTDPGLAEQWPRRGPRRLWTRELGPGYSGIVARGDRLYTMYRADPKEAIVCLDARSGEPVWEHRYDAPLAEGHESGYGDGPNSTPLLAGERLFTIGVAGIMHALDAGTGKVLWSRDLWGGMGGTFLELGYTPSPIPYKNTVIVLVGGEGQGAVAFDPEDGSVIWKGLSFESSYSTPLIASFLGEDRLIAFMATEAVGADPDTGEQKWHYPIRNQYPQNICLPIRVDDDLLFISTHEAGSRGLRLTGNSSFPVEELWSTTRFQCFYSSTVLMGEQVYGVSGYQASPRMMAVNARTGELAWRMRGFAVANVVGVGDRLLILDEDGELTLATPGPDGLTIHCRARILTSPARTPPTILGTVLYARDQVSLVALDLGP
jgi:outer membrane protein assembly factor BamB